MNDVIEDVASILKAHPMLALLLFWIITINGVLAIVQIVKLITGVV